MNFSKEWVLVTSLVIVAGCGSAGQFPVAPVTGTVTCDGRPVPYVVVYFEPLQSGGDALVGKQGIGRADENGKYAVSTYGEHDGAVIARHRVRVGAPNSDVHPDFSCECELNSEKNVLEVEVKKGENNVVNLALTKAAPNSQPSLEQAEAIEEAQQEALEKGGR